MTLGERQELFMRLLPRLVDKAHELGFDVRGGDLFRDPRSHEEYGVQGVYGNKNSNHKLKCAIDLNLFKNGEYLTTTNDHMELGTWWEELHPNTRWGGHYDDANHYELLENPV